MVAEARPPRRTSRPGRRVGIGPEGGFGFTTDRIYCLFMYPGTFAATTPDKPAIIMAGSGDTLTYAELDARSNQLAQYWHSTGLREGDHVALMAENHLMYMVVYWAAMRSGLYLTSVNRYLAADEAAYIINDSFSKSIVTTAALEKTARELLPLIPDCPDRLVLDGPVEGWVEYASVIDQQPTEPLAEEPTGAVMLYSSGTTGRPKGILRTLPGVPIDDESNGGGVGALAQFLLGMTADSIYLSPAPQYHSAPLIWSGACGTFGCTLVVMEKFDERAYLEAVEKYSATHSQLVPTMFVRMLKLPEADRTRYDLSSLDKVVHAAAPCPVEVKKQMIDWWGPIVTEYYAGTEGNGFTFITSEEWLDKPGSVGKALVGIPHVCDDEGVELPAGEPGTIYFENETPPFEYHGDPEKTRATQHPDHANWSALGDIGYLDDDGYIFLTDRKAFMIISGGVNIYPQEIEDALVVHPLVADAAVFGLPDPEMGEYVQAVVQLIDLTQAGPETAATIREDLRSSLAGYKLPRTIDFRDELPRLPTGKLYKRVLKDEYLAAAEQD